MFEQGGAATSWAMVTHLRYVGFADDAWAVLVREASHVQCSACASVAWKVDSRLILLRCIVALGCGTTLRLAAQLTSQDRQSTCVSSDVFAAVIEPTKPCSCEVSTLSAHELGREVYRCTCVQPRCGSRCCTAHAPLYSRL